MAFEKVKLSELSEDTVVSYEDASYTLTVAELKEELKNDDEAAERTWYVVEAQTWQPDARHMLDNYIENEYQDMYTTQPQGAGTYRFNTARKNTGTQKNRDTEPPVTCGNRLRHSPLIKVKR